jgi:uncharacterized protein
VPPAQILWASDAPYGLPLASAIASMRCALQAGLEPAALRSIAGAQLERLLRSEDPLDAGEPPREPRALDPLLERAVAHVTQAIARLFAGAPPDEPLVLARLACAVGDDGPHADVFAAVLEQLELFEEHLVPPRDGRPIPAASRFLVTALVIARTPDVPLPERPDAPHPTREEAES